jgi:hypothetical protein
VIKLTHFMSCSGYNDYWDSSCCVVLRKKSLDASTNDGDLRDDGGDDDDDVGLPTAFCSYELGTSLFTVSSCWMV